MTTEMHELLRVDGTTDMYVAILSTAASSPCDLDMEGFEQTTNKSVYDRSFLRSTKQQMFIIKVIEIRCVALGSAAWSRTAPQARRNRCRRAACGRRKQTTYAIGWGREMFFWSGSARQVKKRQRSAECSASRQFAHVTLACSLLLISARPPIRC
jgi:hypothetical protein